MKHGVRLFFPFDALRPRQGSGDLLGRNIITTSPTEYISQQTP